MDENYSRTEEKQVFLSESEELSKDEPPADFDISIEELTAKLAEKKLVEERVKEEKIFHEVKEEKVLFPIKIEENKPKSFSIKIEEEKPEEHHEHQTSPFKPKATDYRPQTTYHKPKTFLQRHKWLVLFTILLVSSYFLFHPAENNLSSYAVSVSETPIQETVKEIPQTPAVEKIDLREEKLRKLIVDGVRS